MKVINATWKDGRIIPAQPVDWPDGTPLRVEPVEVAHGLDTVESLLGSDRDSIARWIAAYDALPPLRMTAAEEDEWRESRHYYNEYRYM